MCDCTIAAGNMVLWYLLDNILLTSNFYSIQGRKNSNNEDKLNVMLSRFSSKDGIYILYDHQSVVFIFNK